MLASDRRRILASRMREAENEEPYDPEMDGVEPLFYDLDQGGQIYAPPFAFHGDPFLEGSTVDEVLDVDNNDAKGRALESKTIGCELVCQVFRDPQDANMESAVNLPQPRRPDEHNQNNAVGISLPNTHEGLIIVPFRILFFVYAKSCNPHSTRTAHSIKV